MSIQIWQWDGGSITEATPEWVAKRVQPGWSPFVGNGDLVVMTAMGAVRLKKEDWLFFLEGEVSPLKNSLYSVLQGLTLLRPTSAFMGDQRT